MYPVHPSSPTAWSRKYLPDGSSKSSISAGLDKPDVGPSKRTGRQLPGGSRPCRPAPGGSPRWRGQVKIVAPAAEGEAIVAGRRCSVAALLVFLAAPAGLVVRAYATRRQGGQYMLVNRVLASLSRAVCRLNGLGSRGLDRCSSVGTMARLTSPQSRQRPTRPPPRSPGPSAPRPGNDDTFAVHGTSQPSQLLVWQGWQGLFPSFRM